MAERREGKLTPWVNAEEALWFTPEEVYQRREDLRDNTKRLLSLANVIEEIAVEVLQ